MAYSYYNYSTYVNGYTVVKITNPAHTASWALGEMISLLTADGTRYIFYGRGLGSPGNPHYGQILDGQPEATQVSDIAPLTSQSHPRYHPSVGNAAWSTNVESPGYSPGIAYGTYPTNGTDSPALWGTQRDRMIGEDEFIVLDYNLTGILTPGSLVYNNNHVTVGGGDPPNLTSSWTEVVNTNLSGTAFGNAFAQIITADKNRTIFYAFGGESSPGVYNNYIFWCSGTQSGGIMDLSPWYRQDADKNSWLGDQSRASTAFPSAGGTALTIPVIQGIAYGKAAVDTNTTTLFYGGGIKPVYVGSTSSIYGTKEIYGWNYDPATGLITGSAFLAGIMPMGRYKHEMFVANGFLYVVGGATSSYDMSALGSALTNSFHYHIDRAYINHNGQLSNWASCLYEMPMGHTLENTGSGIVDGTAFIHPDYPAPGEDSFIYLLGGIKGWVSGTSFFSRSSGQIWSAKLNYTPGAAILNNPNKLGVDPSWMGPAQGEFLTTGVQLGPNDIKPALPMMENIYQQNMVPTLPADKLVIDPSIRMIGYRPGLRGTEINGQWQLRLGTTPGDFNPNSGSNSTWSHLTSSQVYLRQVRLEFLVDSTQGYGDIQMFNPARERLYKKSAVGLRNGKRLVDIISGSAWWDSGVSYIYTYVQDEYGRTVGLTTNATASDDYAVFTQITGALATYLTGTPSWFLNPPPGEGMPGLPYIPLSSASFGEASVPVTYNPADTSDMINATVGQQLPTPADNTLTAYLARIKAIQKTQDIFEQQLYNTGTDPYFGS